MGKICRVTIADKLHEIRDEIEVARLALLGLKPAGHVVELAVLQPIESVLITAVRAGQTDDVRQVFRALVDFPREEEIAADSAEQLVSALLAVCSALDNDRTVMPSVTCAALKLPAGALYSDGTLEARVTLLAFGERYSRHFG